MNEGLMHLLAARKRTDRFSLESLLSARPDFVSAKSKEPNGNFPTI